MPSTASGHNGRKGRSMKTKHDNKSPTSPEEFARLIGSNPFWSADAILEGMLKRGHAMTLENYLSLAYNVDSLDELDPEDRINVPEFLVEISRSA